MNNNTDISKSINKISEGILSKVVDLALVSIYYGFEVSSGGYSQVGLAEGKAINDLAEINYRSLKRSINYLKRKGLVQTVREGLALPTITDMGKKRLKSIIPQYDNKRVWDNRIYIITYDLPRENNMQRNILRQYLKKIGCGCLQYSVWLTPYNPKNLIEEFVNKHDLDEELILVSSLGRDGTIGEMDLKDLIEKVYKLSKLNDRYQDFIDNVKNNVLTTQTQIIFSFLSILKDDPQIPFKLLPIDWVGDKAYMLYREAI